MTNTSSPTKGAKIESTKNSVQSTGKKSSQAAYSNGRVSPNFEGTMPSEKGDDVFLTTQEGRDLVNEIGSATDSKDADEEVHELITQ
jgi:hypothetical protein